MRPLPLDQRALVQPQPAQIPSVDLLLLLPRLTVIAREIPQPPQRHQSTLAAVEGVLRAYEIAFGQPDRQRQAVRGRHAA